MSEELLIMRFKLGEDFVYEIEADGNEVGYEFLGYFVDEFKDELRSVIQTEGKTGDVFDIKVVRVKGK